MLVPELHENGSVQDWNEFSNGICTSSVHAHVNICEANNLWKPRENKQICILCHAKKLISNYLMKMMALMKLASCDFARFNCVETYCQTDERRFSQIESMKVRLIS